MGMNGETYLAQHGGYSHRTGLGDATWTVKDSHGTVLGNFCVDSGTFGVFPLERVRNMEYNTLDEALELATIIPDFEGEVDFADDFKIAEWNNQQVYKIVGKGNVDFGTQLGA
jgi:hypothetical protein